MHFENVLSSWEFQCQISLWKIPEHIVSDLWCLYLHATLLRMDVGDTAAELEFDIAIQMVLEDVSLEVPENRNGRKNQLSTKTLEYFKASKFSWKNDSAKSLFFTWSKLLLSFPL